MTPLELLPEIERMGRQRAALVAKWRAEKPPRPQHVIDQGERDVNVLRHTLNALRGVVKAEMNRGAL
jgi:hypothetical protein